MRTFYARIILVSLALFLVACGSEEPAGSTPEPTNPPVATDEPAPATSEPAPTEAPAEPTAAPAEPTAAIEPTEPAAAAAPTTNLTDGCVEQYDEAVDYFPEKVTVSHSQGFTVEYFNHYKLVTVTAPYVGAAESVQYVLLQCGTPRPEGFDAAAVIEVPVNSIVAMSTTYLPALVELGLADRLVGLDTPLYVTNPTVRELIDDGVLAEIGSGPDVNVEVALDLNPDLIMTYASGFPEFDAYPILEQAGLPIALNADYTDLTPLGRAEWIDYIALFFNKEAAAEQIFGDIATEYDALLTLAATAGERPTVFTNAPFEGIWYMPGGASYTARLLADAGADYLWADDESSGTLYLDFEAVFAVAADADYWLHVGYFPTMADLLAADERFGEFAAFQNGNVWNYDAITNEAGGIDFFESGAQFPNLVLADMIKIFHPDLLPDHEFVYHRPVQ